MTNWIRNGQSIRAVEIDERAAQYGDGIFETVAIRKGEPRLWQYHLERLAQGCERLKFGMPDADELLDGLFAALDSNNVPSAYATVKIIVSAGVGSRGYGRSEVLNPSVWTGAFSARPVPLVAYTDGVTTTLCETRLAANSALAGLKSLNRLEQVLARSELMQTNYFEGLTMGADGSIICGTMSNVFFVRNNIVMTSSIESAGVRGVMRRQVLETLRCNEIPVELSDTHAEELGEIDEVFLSNSQFGVLPVQSCDDHEWRVGNLTQKLSAMLADSGISEGTQ